MENATKWYDAHLEEYRKIAYIKSMEEYQELYRRSLEDVDKFWGEAAKEYISWYKTGILCCVTILRRPISSGSGEACLMSPTTAWTGIWTDSKIRWPIIGKETIQPSQGS